jgi:hypothetical protein
MLRSRMAQYTEHAVSLVENSIGEVDEATGVTLMDGPSGGIVPPPIPDRQAIYNRNMLNGDADIG